MSGRMEATIGEETFEMGPGDLVYIPQNTVHQHFNDDPAEPLVFLSAQNRVFKYLGYDSVVYIEDASAGRAEDPAMAPAMKGA